eukprot:998342_1
MATQPEILQQLDAECQAFAAVDPPTDAMEERLADFLSSNMARLITATGSIDALDHRVSQDANLPAGTVHFVYAQKPKVVRFAAKMIQKLKRSETAHRTLYSDVYGDYGYEPLSQWNDHYDVGRSLRLDSNSDNIDGIHREMALGAIGLLVVTCCLFACCIFVWTAFLCVFKRSNDNKRRSVSSYDVITSDHEHV